MEQQDIITIEDLSITFQSGDRLVSAVRELSFSIRAGRTLAIVGESGSGKSVSSLSLMGLLPPNKTHFDSGHFHLSSSILPNKNGSETVTIRPDNPLLKTIRGKRIAMIFQEPMTSLNPVISCGEQVGEMLLVHTGISREKMRERVIGLFQEVMLPRPEEMFDQYPHQLSGGQRQRVMIAMAISCGPDVLIADEPTTALDVTVQKEILALLSAICKKRGMAMVFITHDLGVVEEIADDILVMRKGEMLESGQVRHILSQPQNPYTRGLLACRPTPDKKNYRLHTVADFINSTGPVTTLRTNNNISGPVNSEEPLLTVTGVTKEYTQTKGLFRNNVTTVKAVNEVSFEIFKNETLGLVGESGCGKTTLSRMLLGLIQPTAGSIRYKLNNQQHSVDLAGIDAPTMQSLRKHVQIIFQDPYSSLNPKMSVISAITEPMRVYGLHENEHNRKQKAAELLQKVGLEEAHLYRYPHEFSGGQRQRIVIARALACEPAFIVCDESVSALDVSVQAQVLNLLNDLKSEFGLTYLFISHDLNVVYYMCDRIMVMNRGRVEEIGPADQVFLAPTSEYTRKLIAAIPGKSA
jgi:peptide/nickel transport system ATP-binding protein